MPPEVGEQVARTALVMAQERIAEIDEFLHITAGLVARAAYDSIRAQKALELEELRDSLIHMIVHDLRTPLPSIMGSLQTVAATEYDSEITQEFVPTALSSTDALLVMVNTLLDINKMESGEIELELGPVEFASVAHAAVEQLKGLVREHNHDLVSEIGPTCPAIWADEDKLRRIAINLVTPSSSRLVRITSD